MSVNQAVYPTLRLMVVVLVICAPWGQAPARTPPAPTVEETGAALLDDGFELLRQGLLRSAEETFGEVERLRPDDPAPPYYRALAVWWQRIFDDHPETLEPRFHDAVERSMALGKKSDRPEAKIYLGSAHLLRAQVRADSKEVLKAGLDARRGKRALEAGLREAPHATDAYFGLGAYNYYADHVNALVKGIRFLLFIPGGNAQLGLRQLELAADRGERARLESHLLLAVILSSERERSYEEALKHARRARILAPASPAVVLALAELLDGTGREDEAERELEAFLESSGEANFDYHAQLRARGASHLARIHLRRARPLDARDALRRALSGSGDNTSEAVVAARRMLLQTEWDLGSAEPDRARGWGIDFPPADGCREGQFTDLADLEERVARAGTGWTGVQPDLHRLTEAAPCNGTPLPRRWLALGTVALMAGDVDGAVEQFQGVVHNDPRGSEAAGWSQIFLGRIAAARGLTEEASERFRVASRMHGFSDRLRADYYLENPEAAPWPGL